MSQENVEIVRRLYTMFSDRDFSAANEASPEGVMAVLPLLQSKDETSGSPQRQEETGCRLEWNRCSLAEERCHWR